MYIFNYDAISSHTDHFGIQKRDSEESLLTFVSLFPRSKYYSPVENQNDLELDFKVFFFADSCCSDNVHDESN